MTRHRQAATLPKGADSYLGFLYAMEDVVVYGYLTPLRVKIILALALTDAVVRDKDVIEVRPSITHLCGPSFSPCLADIQGLAYSVLPRHCQSILEAACATG